MRTLDCIAVHGTARITQFMQAADVFEPWKVFAQPARYAVTLKPDCTDAQAIQDVKRLLEAAGERVVAVFVPSHPETCWRDASVRAISHGTHWGLLDDCLHYYGAMPKEQTPCPT